MKRMKKFLVLTIVLAMLAMTLVGCSQKETETPVTSDPANEQSPTTSGDTEQEQIRIGFALKTLDNPFFVALEEEMIKSCEAYGWEITVLDAKMDVENEQRNMETFIAQKVDFILLDAIDPLAAVQMVENANAAGIPVIEVDAPIDPSAEVVTTIYSNNPATSREVGLYAATFYDEDEMISSVILSGAKGNPGGEERRLGMFAGILESRLELSEDEALTLAQEFDQELLDNGKAFHDVAKFEVLGQGYANWTADLGLPAMEDLLVANSDINCVLSENDNMILGGMKALEARDMLDQVSIFAAADGQKEAYEEIMKKGPYKCTGDNNPASIAELSAKTLHEILVEGKDPKSYPSVLTTPVNVITIDNVDEFYNPDAAF